MIFHVISVAQARTWKIASERIRQTTTPAQHPAI